MNENQEVERAALGHAYRVDISAKRVYFGAFYGHIGGESVKLSELKAHLIVRTGELDHPTLSNFRYTEDFSEAEGVWFACPACFAKNGGLAGTHYICCWSPKVPLGVSPGPGRWEMHGTGIHDLTLEGDSARQKSRSVHLTGAGCGAHFYVTNGEIQMC